MKKKIKTLSFFDIKPTTMMHDKAYEILSILQLSLLEIKYILYCVGGLVTRKPIPRGLWYGYDVELVENILSQIISKTYSFMNEFHFGSNNVVHRVTTVSYTHLTLPTKA